MKNTLTRLVLILFGTIAPLLPYEIYLRYIDYTPLSAQKHASIFRLTSLYSKDEVLGWKLNPGSYQLIPVSDRAKQTTANIIKNGSRATHATENNLPASSKRKIIFVGDSFTFGDGLNDNETYPWNVQEKLSNYEILNFAVPGYGTCQTYLKLKLLLDSAEYDNAYIIYGLSEFQEDRNLPDRKTAWMFAAVSPDKTFQTPSCILNSAGELEITSVKSYIDPLPLLSENLSVARRLIHFYYNLIDIKTHSLKRPLSFKLLSDMNEQYALNRRKFMVLMQRFEPESRLQYQKFFNNSAIRFIDGSHTLENSASMQLIGDKHPNARMNLYWSELISTLINSEDMRSAKSL